MDSTDLNDIPSVRLASGVEMQQRWPTPDQHHHHQQQPHQPQPHQPQPLHQHQPQKTVSELPRLMEMAPTRGSQGTVVTVVVQSLPHQLVPVKLAFNSLVVDTKQMQAQGITSLVAAVPPFQQTHSSTANVPISICMLDKDSVTETWPVAEFVYEFENKESTANTTPTLTAASTNSSNDTSSIQYAATTPSEDKRHDIESNSYQSRENFLGGSSNATTYDSFYQQPAVNNYNNMNNQQQQMSQYSYNYNTNNSPRNTYNDNKFNAYRPSMSHSRTSSQHSMTNYNSNATGMNLFNSNNSGFGGMLTSFDQNESLPPTPGINGAPSTATTLGYPQQSIISTSPPTATPQQQQQVIQQQQRQQPTYSYGKSSVHVPTTSVANYQPYPGLVSRANLKIMSDLDSMAKNWAPEEWEHRRRLVQFWREQNGNEIRCTFDPVAQGERTSSNSGHIVVSCIYWAERNDCFITSVDCIHLLESLMDIRFSVEEKNRVRRNLEGFRPLTVSKCKAESAEFFKLIMGFPNPKPRNIEKDVKVFPWKTLPYALKKIVTKYTASSYNSNHGSQQRRAQMNKHTTAATPPLATPPVTTANTSSYMAASSTTPIVNQDNSNNMNQFYQHPYQQQQQQQYSAYHPQSSNEQQQQIPVSSTMYQTTSSVPAYSSTSYTQQQNTSPIVDTTASPRLQYPYSDMMNNGNINRSDTGNSSTSSTTPPNQDISIRRTSLTNRQDFSIL